MRLSDDMKARLPLLEARLNAFVPTVLRVVRVVVGIAVAVTIIDVWNIIVFSEIGMIGGLTKVFSNSTYSRLGLVVRLVNKWTCREEPFLLEITRNIDGFLDAFREKPSPGLNIFR